MQHVFPNDADGDALRKVIECGSDLSKPMLIDFQVVMPDESSALAFATVASALGYQVRNYESEGCKLPWTCECSTRTLAIYEVLIAIQIELAELSLPFGGVPDGWGTFGNRVPDDPL